MVYSRGDAYPEKEKTIVTLNPECICSPARFWIPALMLALGLVACNSESASSPDGSLSDGSSPNGSADGSAAPTCGADTPAGQACNNAPDNGPVITPTCAMGTMPTGTGGTIVAGTYHLTAQTYYNTPACPTTPLSGTFVIGGGCVQSSSDTPLSATSSGTLVVHGNIAEITQKCVNAGSLQVSLDAPNWTFTATPTTLTLFTMNAQAGNRNPDRVQVFARE